MISRYLFAAALCFAASGASAEVLVCKQSSISSSGFNSIAAAQSWFVKEFAIEIRGNEARSNVYGLGTVEDDKGRKRITFVSASSTNVRTDVQVTFIPKTSVYTQRLVTTGNYAQTPGARGKCVVRQ